MIDNEKDGVVLLEVCMWMYTGDRQSARIRTMYVKALITQDVGFFDTDISTGEVVMGISSDTSLIQDAIGVKVCVAELIKHTCFFFLLPTIFKMGKSVIVITCMYVYQSP